MSTSVKPLFLAVGAFTFTGAFIAAPAAHAATYYVATTGDNNDAGTEAAPWRTVQHAVNTMVAGDTTYVRGGEYIEGMIRFKKSGTASAPIKLLNYPGESPVIDCNNVGTNMILITHASGDLVPLGYIAVEGFEIRDCYCGIKWTHLQNGVIRRNWIHHNRTQGILGNSGKNNLIDSNIIHANGSDPTQSHGIYANGNDITITNNVIYDNMCFGIQHNGAKNYDPSKHPGREWEESQNWIIANNTIAYQKCAAVAEWGPHVDNSRIENNIFYENRIVGGELLSNGIHFLGIGGAGGSTGMRFSNNLSYASGSGGKAFLSNKPDAIEGINFTLSGNIVNTLAPNFVAAPAELPASPNFALTAQSPAIDSGLTLSEVTVDVAGVTRPQGPGHDIGAYEWCADDDCSSGGAGGGGGGGGESSVSSSAAGDSATGTGSAMGPGAVTSGSISSGGGESSVGGAGDLADGSAQGCSCRAASHDSKSKTWLMMAMGAVAVVARSARGRSIRLP